MNVCQLTKYPKLFSKVYWGNFIYKEGESTGDPKIISNRNKFVREFDISKIEDGKTVNKLFFHDNNVGNKLDHIEAYRTKTNGIVCVASEYGNKTLPDSATKIGFKKYSPLYSELAITYLAYFTSIDDVKKAIKTLKTVKKE